MILGKKGSKKWSKKWSKSGIFWKIPGSNIPGERGGVKNEHVLSRFFKTVKKRQLLRPNFFTVFQFFSVQKWPFLGHFAQVATWGFGPKITHFWPDFAILEGPKLNWPVVQNLAKFAIFAKTVQKRVPPKMAIFWPIFWALQNGFFRWPKSLRGCPTNFSIFAKTVQKVKKRGSFLDPPKPEIWLFWPKNDIFWGYPNFWGSPKSRKNRLF